MKESAFRNSVQAQLPKSIHKQPMLAGMMGTAGTPDSYYDHKRDLWVEYKALDRDDHLPAVIPKDKMPTELQVLWLNRRFAAGGNACVIVGVKLRGRAHGFVLDSPQVWSQAQGRDVYEPLLRSAPQLAAYILERIS